MLAGAGNTECVFVCVCVHERERERERERESTCSTSLIPRRLKGEKNVWSRKMFSFPHLANGAGCWTFLGDNVVIQQSKQIGEGVC